MNKNLLSPAEYPKNKLSAYSYVQKLEQQNPELYYDVQNLLSKGKANLTQARQPSLKRLEALWKKEREKEIEVIKFLTKNEPSFSVPEKTGQYIRTINHLFGIDAVFERNLGKIKEIAQGGKNGRIDITAFFNSYLETELRQALEEGIFKNQEIVTISDLKEIFYNAMIKMLKAEDNGQQAYLQLALALEKLKLEEREELLNDIFYLYFGKSISELTKDFKNASGKIGLHPADVKITKGKGFQGNVLETVEQLSLLELQEALKRGRIKASAISTGKSGGKADNILTIGFALTEEQQEILSGSASTSSSVRAQNIQRMQDLHDSIKKSKQSGYIVEISDKNYNLTSSYFANNKGFTAQGGVKLSNLQQTLKSIKYQHSKVNDIIFILANSGDDMINGDNTSETLHYLATLIGYFLFDDIDIKNFVPEQPQAVHLLNLNGIYIPLSVFLEAACEAFLSAINQPSDFVYVDFKESDDAKNYNKDNLLTLNDWVEFRRSRMENSSVNFHFFGNFVNFISEKII